MRVDLDYMNVNQSVDNGTNTISHGSTDTSRSDRVGAYAVDISGQVTDNKAYGGQGKTTEDVMQEAGQINVAQQKDYMTVMSNSMSEEDFAKLQEEGYQPGDTEIETMVTVVDRIKAELVKAGVDVNGYTDTLDTDTLAAITGNKAQAQSIAQKLKENDVPVTKENIEQSREALEKAGELSELSDGAIKYMIQNHMEPTIDHIYTAEYSATGDGNRQGKGYYADSTPGYYAKKAESIDFDQLEPQIEKKIQEAGLTVNEESKENAKWLIEKGIPLTADALQQLEVLKNIDMRMSENPEALMDQIAQAIGTGKKAGEATFYMENSIYQQATDLIGVVEKITEEAVEQVVESGQTINLKNLSEEQKRINEAAYQSLGNQEKQNHKQANTSSTIENINEIPEKISTAKKQLEEIRLQMTVEANVKLLKKGIHIDTTELEALVKSYESVKEEQNKILFGDTGTEDVSEKASLYEETLEKVTRIASMPAAVVGQAVAEGNTFTLNYVHEKGIILQNAYQAAGETYEALMTAPRNDLGDSIRKAFRKVDDLLDEIDLEVTDTNRRAARILGYNQMDISKENIETVKAADEELTRVVNKMTPAATVQLIRDGVNPLETDMTSMEAYLTQLDSDTLNESEKYAKYLYKLEQNKEISQEEKEAYIGIYRLIRQVEKSDGAVIGSLVNQGAEISFQNLLSAVRSNKKTGMNVTVDENFGGVDATMQNGKSISQQINRMNEIAYEKQSEEQVQYEKNLAGDILDQLNGSMDPTVLSQIMEQGTVQKETFNDQFLSENTTTLEQLAAQLKQNDTLLDNTTEKAYQLEQLQQIRQVRQIEESVVQSLIDFDQPITIDNLLAANEMQHNRGSAYGKLYENASHGEKERLEKVFRGLQNRFSKNPISDTEENSSLKDGISEAYEDLQVVAEEIMKSKIDEGLGTSIDVKSMALTFKQISLVTNLAKEENYEVPVKIGDEITSINLRIVRGSDSSKVTATTDTALYGKVAAEFTATPTSISGYLATDSKDGYGNLKEMESNLMSEIGQSAKAFSKEDKSVSIQTIYVKTLDINKYQERSKEEMDHQKVSSKELYGIAKSVINTLQTGTISR